MLSMFENYLVYPGSSYPKGNWEPEGFVYEEIQFESTDGTKLVGWYLPKSNADYDILLSHGNAENVAQASAYMGDLVRNKLNANVFVYDYRGYGKSEGNPFEPGVLMDSEAALQWLCERNTLNPEDVIHCGHSIGGGPAVHLAARFGAKALVIQQSFSSIVAAASHHYPWVPVSWVMRNRFRSDKKIKNYDGPFFQSHGDCDDVVPIAVGKALFEASPSEYKQFFERKGLGHYNHRTAEYWQALQDFLEGIDDGTNRSNEPNIDQREREPVTGRSGG